MTLSVISISIIGIRDKGWTSDGGDNSRGLIELWSITFWQGRIGHANIRSHVKKGFYSRSSFSLFLCRSFTKINLIIAWLGGDLADARTSPQSMKAVCVSGDMNFLWLVIISLYLDLDSGPVYTYIRIYLGDMYKKATAHFKERPPSHFSPSLFRLFCHFPVRSHCQRAFLGGVLSAFCFWHGFPVVVPFVVCLLIKADAKSSPNCIFISGFNTYNFIMASFRAYYAYWFFCFSREQIVYGLLTAKFTEFSG